MAPQEPQPDGGNRCRLPFSRNFSMTKTLRRLAATLCLVALPAVAMAQTTTTTPPASPVAPAGDPVVAKVNGKELHRSDVIESARSLPEPYQQQIDQLFPALIERLIDLNLLAAEGRRQNLQNDPAVKAQVANYEDQQVREAVLDRYLKSKVSDEAIKARYQKFLKDNLLPKSQGDFRLGADMYRKKLLYEEMVETPLDRLLAIGYADLRKNQEAFRATAAKLDSKRTPQQVLEQVEKDHPPAAGLLQAFRDSLAGLRDFIVKHNIVTIPSPVPPILEETPPFMRALTSASMDTPGPYEKVAKEAFFNVTLPEKDWPAARIEDFLQGDGSPASRSHQTQPKRMIVL
jgi:hypothetical protein